MLIVADALYVYGPVGMLVLIAIVFGLGGIAATTVLGPGRQGDVKGITYESGMDPIGTARKRFNVRFYLLAMTFLLFDVEIVFLYPWAVVFPNLPDGDPLNGAFIGRIGFFVATSILAYVYAWRKGVFRFD